MTAPTGSQPAVLLDWRRHRVNNPPRLCRLCPELAFMTDEKGRPCHKVCAEDEIARLADFHARSNT